MHLAYVVKRYPRYSETFIVNEILAHERAGEKVRIYALLPPQDSHFQDIIAQVRAPVTYLSSKADRASAFWELQKRAAQTYPNLWHVLAQYTEASAREITQALELALHIHRHKIEHIHAHFATTATTVSQIAASLCQLPSSFTAHAKDIFHQDNDYEQIKSKFAKADFSVTVSDYNVDYLSHSLGVEQSKLVRIYNGLDLTQFPFHPYQDRPPKLIAVGRLVEKKGFDDLIRACAILRDKGTPFSCEIIGSGDQHDRLYTLVQTLNLENHVDLIGPMPQELVKQKITQSAMFIAPCVVASDNNKDGLPTVLVESMALGTPCISTDVTGIPEVIHDNDTGLMVKSRSPELLATAIERLLLDQPLAQSIATKARYHMESHFNIDINTRTLRNCFQTHSARSQS